ncbi:hypothetical protein [Pseudomonas sp. AKS31]|nr:hypothetical protein [Pseudomonas sp. AKS31]MCL9799467.1 hypothetical protein [Pseudomonas sp. AKS31]
MTDPPVTVSPPTRRGEAFCFYIEALHPPKIGRFAMACLWAKRLFLLTA